MVAQETGIALYQAFLQYCGPQACVRTSSTILSPLIEKGLALNRAGTKSKTIECLALLVELDTPEPVIEALLPFLSHRLPKLVLGVLTALVSLFTQFGARTIDPKPLIPLLPPLFAHADRKIRAEVIALTVQIRSWLGPALDAILFDKIKPVHQKELTELFGKAEKPTQTRFLRSQVPTEAEAEQKEEIEDVPMEDVDPPDAYDLAEPVAVLDLIPSSLGSALKSAKWKERKEALEEIRPRFLELKYANSDYTEFIKLMSKCIGKDVNLQVVQLATEIVDGLAKGLRLNFERYVPLVFTSALERTKEKKPTVLEPLLSLLDTLVGCLSFSTVLPEIVDVLTKTRIPKVKEEGFRFVAKCLKNVEVMPEKEEIALIMTPCIKGSTDGQVAVRNAAQEAIGVLMKVVGERRLAQHLEGIDESRMKKIREFSEVEVRFKGEVKQSRPVGRNNTAPQLKKHTVPSVTSSASKPSGSSSNRRSLSKPLVNSSAKPLSKAPAPSLTPSVPIKREASSPLKSMGNAKASRGLGVGSLAGRLDQVSRSHVLSNDEREELEALREQRRMWEKERQELLNSVEIMRQEKTMVQNELSILKMKHQQVVEELAATGLKLKQKDTQISRLIVDFEKAQQQVYEAEEKLRNMGNGIGSSLAGSVGGVGSRLGNRGSRLSLPPGKYGGRGSIGGISSMGVTSSTAGPATTGIGGANLKRYSLQKEYRDFKEGAGEIGAGVSKLTIEEKENRKRRSLDGLEEWKRANEVTINLKARIEKMKLRSRNI